MNSDKSEVATCCCPVFSTSTLYEGPGFKSSPAFLCGGCMFLLWLHGFSPGISPTVQRLICNFKYKVSVNGCLSVFCPVINWQPVQVRLHPPFCDPELDKQKTKDGWMDGIYWTVITWLPVFCLLAWPQVNYKPTGSLHQKTLSSFLQLLHVHM